MSTIRREDELQNQQVSLPDYYRDPDYYSEDDINHLYERVYEDKSFYNEYDKVFEKIIEITQQVITLKADNKFKTVPCNKKLSKEIVEFITASKMTFLPNLTTYLDRINILSLKIYREDGSEIPENYLENSDSTVKESDVNIVNAVINDVKGEIAEANKKIVHFISLVGKSEQMIFQTKTEFTANEGSNFDHAIQLPANMFNAVTIGKSTIFSDIQVMPVVPSSISNNFWNEYESCQLLDFYMNVCTVPNLRSQDTAWKALIANSTTSTFKSTFFTYENFYRLCRYKAFILSYVSVDSRCETIISNHELRKDEDWDIEKFLDDKDFDAMMSFINAVFVIKAFSFWQTNHNVGQGKVTNIWKKGLHVLGFQAGDKEYTDDQNRDVFSVFYNAIHFVDVRNLLASIMAAEIPTKIAAGFAPVKQMTLDFFSTLRVDCFPCGTAKLAFITAVYPRMIAAKVHFLSNTRDQLMEYFNIMKEYRKNPALFHIGADYLFLGTGIKSYGRIANTWELLISHCASFVSVFIPHSSLRDSFVYKAAAASKFDTGFEDLIKSVKMTELSGGALQSLALLIKGGDISAEFMKIYQLPEKEEKEKLEKTAQLNNYRIKLFNECEKDYNTFNFNVFKKITSSNPMNLHSMGDNVLSVIKTSENETKTNEIPSLLDTPKEVKN